MVEAGPNQPKIHLTYLQYHIMIDELYKKLRGDVFNKSVMFDGVYGIPRGGSNIAMELSHKLKLPMLEKCTEQTLIVDDISDSGKTLQKYKGKKIATLFMRHNTQVRPDYYVHELKDDSWIIFPYEVE